MRHTYLGVDPDFQAEAVESRLVLSMLQILFECLIFKAGVNSWSERVSAEELPVRSLALNFACQILVFLYMLDNGASWIVVASTFVGAGIEAWKLYGALEVDTGRAEFPFVSVSVKPEHKENEESVKNSYSVRAGMMYVYPVVAVYSVYTLIHKNQRSFYSWILRHCVASAYALGFVLMSEQLYVNHKLQSVPHLSREMLIYKMFNVVIDDLLAIVLEVPTFSRLSCLRDDVIFLIFLVQRSMYAVDPKREEEFGMLAKHKHDWSFQDLIAKVVAAEVKYFQLVASEPGDDLQCRCEKETSGEEAEAADTANNDNMNIVDGDWVKID
mmetsp:Transcript_148/g.228  ORF Transcript_148/g.228 Transcript_148/m.228 type:complete len:327 (+) Transcript_148:202-1182(+)